MDRRVGAAVPGGESQGVPADVESFANQAPSARSADGESLASALGR